MRAHNVALQHYKPTGKYTLLAADGLDPEGVVIAIYATREEAEVALDEIFFNAAKRKPTDLKKFDPIARLCEENCLVCGRCTSAYFV